MEGKVTKKSPFSELHHISIVVRDLDEAAKFYTSVGIGPFVDYPPMKEYVKIDVPDEKGFYNLKIKVARIGPVDLQLVQPGEGESIYKDFLEKRGEGVFHLGFVVDDIEKSEEEVRRRGLNVISSGRRENGSGFAYLDTTEKGGVTLLVRQSPPEK
jgi:catechol 2,3-dioxygenase-like lactoylglutathione lyase family enzyme